MPKPPKYAPLFEHLCRAADTALDMSFDEIEALVGTLPDSAGRLRSWWSNDPGGRPAQAKAWLDAGRVVETVDFAARRVRFSAARWTRGA